MKDKHSHPPGNSKGFRGSVPGTRDRDQMYMAMRAVKVRPQISVNSRTSGGWRHGRKTQSLRRPGSIPSCPLLSGVAPPPLKFLQELRRRPPVLLPIHPSAPPRWSRFDPAGLLTPGARKGHQLLEVFTGQLTISKMIPHPDSSPARRCTLYPTPAGSL